MSTTTFPDIALLKEELVSTIGFLHKSGWAPATSSNYSFRIPGSTGFFISESGIDKGVFNAENLIEVDEKGVPVAVRKKTSAETLLHVLLYEKSRDTGCILHTHSVNDTVLSLTYEEQGGVNLEGFEILKGLSGITTHNTSVFVPVFPNAQDMKLLSQQIRSYYNKHPDMQAFLLAGHGCYTWGAGIAEAKRHMEVFQFLFQCKIKLDNYGHTIHS